jgi:hypothetical protein
MKYSKRFILIALLLLSIGFIWSCNKKRIPASQGPVDEISVMADKTDWETFQTDLRKVFEKEIETPAFEKILNLDYYPIAELSKHQLRRNLVFISTLTSAGETINYIKQMLRPEDLQKVETGQSFFFKKENPWAFNQMLLVLVAKDAATLRQKLAENDKLLFEIFNDRLERHYKGQIYAKGEQRKLELDFKKKYGWSLRIQHEFQIFQEIEKKNLVMLTRDYPKRWITISWQDSADSENLTPEWCTDFRNQAFANFNGEEKINSEYLRTKNVTFAGQPALKLEGLYEGYNPDGWPKGYGGPFGSYYFYEPTQKRIYMVDYSIFAPDREKAPFLRILNLIVNTFYVAKSEK